MSELISSCEKAVSLINGGFKVVKDSNLKRGNKKKNNKNNIIRYFKIKLKTLLNSKSFFLIRFF